MDYFFSAITDISLRRLYKFVLKRTIGKYIEDELLIDQLEVHSRDGLVRLNDIRLNADVLNEELADLLPIKIVSITISQLEVHLSYKTLLTDSCRFVVKGVEIVIAPNELYAKVKADQKRISPSKPERDDADEAPLPPIPPQTSAAGEGQKGLSFIAHWIEVVVARLQVQVDSVNITLQLPTTVSAPPATSSAAAKNTEPQRRHLDPLSRSKLTQPATHSIQLSLRNIHYFNDDPAAYSAATDASSIAISTKLTQGTDASVALQLGSRKLVKLDSISVQLVPIKQQQQAWGGGSPASEGPQSLETLQLLRLGSHLAATVKLDKSQSGQLKGLEVELTVPNLLLSVDIHSAKCLCAAITTYLALTAPESPKPGVSSTSRGAGSSGGQHQQQQSTSKSLMQKVLMSDPTLRTLFWLEEEENRKNKNRKSSSVSGAGGSGGRSSQAPTGMRGVGEEGDDIDLARVAQLMRQYRTTRNALVPEPLTSSTLAVSSALGASAMLGASRVVDSDSEGDFPVSDESSSDAADGEEDSSVGSEEFHDAFAKKPVVRVKMGETRRSAMKGSSLGSSSFGTGNRTAAESGLFHSTTSGLLGASTTSHVYASGYNGSVYASAAPPLVLSGRLHVLVADVVFTHLSARDAILSPPALDASTTSSVAASVAASITAGATAEAPPRDELNLHLEEVVMRVSTVFIPPPPPSGPSPFLKATPVDVPRNTITCTISVNEVQLLEAYSGFAYDVLRTRAAVAAAGVAALDLSAGHTSAAPPPQKQVIVSFHSLQDSRRIFASPHVNVSVDYLPAADKSLQLSPVVDPSCCASIKATVNIEPVVVSASVAMIEHWVQGLSGFPLISVAEEESSTNIACTVQVVQLELFLHCDNRAENYHTMSQQTASPVDSHSAADAVTAAAAEVDAHTAYWDTVLDAVDLVQQPEAWSSLRSTTTASPYYEHLIASRGGFRFLLSDISIKLATAARPKHSSNSNGNNRGGALGDSTLLSGSSVGSVERRACRANSAEALFQAVEMTQVALYVYISLPVASSGIDLIDPRRRFYSTLLVRATASDNRAHKVVISRTNPHVVSSAISRPPSDDPEDQEFVLLKDAYRSAPSSVPTSQPRAAADKADNAGTAQPGRGAATPVADQGPTAPVVNVANLIYVSAYHIQVDIKQREYNVLMMVSDSISPQPSSTGAAAGAAKAPKGSPKEPLSPVSAANSGFGFVLTSKIATICLSDNEPRQFSFPELDALIAETRRKGGAGSSRRQSSLGSGNGDGDESCPSKCFSICVSIIEPSIEVLLAHKDIYLSIKADDLSIYEMELPQFRALLQSGFDFNQTTGREARYGPNRHLVPFIRRASLHSLDTSGGSARNEAFSTLLGNNQDYGRAFEVRLLLSSSYATAAAAAAAASPTEVKSVHFFIDFYDIMLSYDPQSTWILSVANMLTPQTAAQILCHRQEERVRAAVRRYHQLSVEQKDMLGTTLEELVANLTTEQTAPLHEPTDMKPPLPPTPGSNEGEKKGPITLALPFELTKVNVRVRNCIVDFCCDPCSSRTFLTIGLLTVSATIVSNSPRFSLKFKVGGLSLYISDVLPLPTVQEVGVRKDATKTDEEDRSSNLINSALYSSSLNDSMSGSGYRGGSRFRKNPVLFGASSQSAYDSSAAREPGAEIYDEDIGQFFKAHSFVDLASVDHIDVLVTINNSEQEALVIQINIGQCSINACVDSLELFAKTMGEWFLEFQVACAKSEEVMQKKSNKPMRDLGTSHYAFQAPTGNLLDDENFDTIRFCDTLPGALTNYPGVSPSTTGAAAVGLKPQQALPASLLEDVPLSELIAKAEQEEANRAAAGAARGVFVQSTSTAATNMSDLVVEDYYSGLSLPAEDMSAKQQQTAGSVQARSAASAQVGVYSPFLASPHPASEQSPPPPLRAVHTAPAGMSLATPQALPLERQGTTESYRGSRLEAQWEAQYDYDDEYDFNPPVPPTTFSTRVAQTVTVAPPAAVAPSLHAAGSSRSTQQGEDEEDGVGGFYHSEDPAVEGGGEDAMMELGESDGEGDYSPMGAEEADGDDDCGAVGAVFTRKEGGQELMSPETDDTSLPSVKSIALDDSVEGYGEQSGLSRSGMDEDEDEEEEADAGGAQMSRSVFGLGNFSLWNTPAPRQPAPEEFELKDFNPAAPTVASEDDFYSDNVDASNDPDAPAAVIITADGQEPQEWMQQELSASQRTLPRSAARSPHAIVAISHQQCADFAYSSDPEDGNWTSPAPVAAHEKFEKSTNPAGHLLAPQYEADFGEGQEASFEADFGDEEASSRVPVEQQAGERVHAHTTTQQHKDAASDGWRRFPDGLNVLSMSPGTSFKAAPTLTLPAEVTQSAEKVEQPVPAELQQLDDLDRAWQQQQNDYIYDSSALIATAIVPSDDQVRKIAHFSAAAAATGSVQAAAKGTVPSSHQQVTVPAPAEGARKANRAVQPMQAAQWYLNPDQLEVMPHYIPVVSRSEDLDDNRPAEEKSLNTKMLMKLKGNFKIRLFEGSDWHRRSSAPAPPTAPAKEDTATTTTSAAAGVASATVAAAQKTEGTAANRSVRFRKEELLNDLTAPPSSHRPPTTASAGGGTGSRAASASSSRGSSSRPPRSSRPLFEESFSAGRGASDTKAATDSKPAVGPSSAAQQSPKPRNERDMLDATFKELFFCVRVYDNSSTGATPVVYSLPTQRIALSTLDFLVSFGKVGMRRKKVVGSWTSLTRPRDTLEPVVRIAFLAYENPPIAGQPSTGSSNSSSSEVCLEHRLYVRVLPLRVYLDEQVISFAKALAAANTARAAPTGKGGQSAADAATKSERSSSATERTSSPAGGGENTSEDKEIYFQSILIAAMEIKIDYHASTVNIQALHGGDYLQLLNIFPLDGLEITLKHVKLNGVRGVPVFLQRMGEFWVKDIYANQLHRVISGTAPFRGLSNIGNDLQELLAIPLRDYRKTGGTLKQLRRSTRTLVRTVTRETLHATQQLTMFVANAITELASDGSAPPAPTGAHRPGTATPPAGRITEHGQQTNRASQQQHRRAASEPAHQPASVVEGLQMAYGSVTRELGSAAETVIAIPIREYVQTGPGGYLKSVIRALPIAILRPVAGVVEGVSYTMLGLRNDLDPAARLDEEDVWNVDIGTSFPGSPVPRVATGASYQVRESR